MNTLAERLTYARELRGLSQAALAEKAGCSQSTIGNAESGTRKTLRNIAAVARALEVSVDWLADAKGAKPTAQGKETPPAVVHADEMRGRWTAAYWPFKVRPEVFREVLNRDDISRVDAYISSLVETRESDQLKRQSGGSAAG